MGKPSIFSKEYDRRMKARKKRKTVLMVLVIVVLIIFGSNLYVKNWLKNNPKTAQPKTNTNLASKPGKTNTDTNGNKQTQQNTNQQEETATNTDKTLDVTLPDGQILNITYTESNGVKKFENISCVANPELYFNISPSGSKSVVLNTNQDMFLIDDSGTVTNITKDIYTTKKGKSINKSDYIKDKPGFLWHATPKFINENMVVYVSQMPWFNEKKYLWKIDLTNKTHAADYSIQGNDLTLDKMTDKGLTVNVDGQTKYIGAQGNLVD